MLYVLGFGSREWTDQRWIDTVMDDLARENDGEIRFLHGDCPRGADRMCAMAAGFLGWRVKAMPADWARHRRGAGPIRNREMAELLVDRRSQGHEVLGRGFSSTWPKPTPGTSGMAALLDAAAIPYRLYGPTGEVADRPAG